MKSAEVKLKPGKEKPISRRHPWIFSGAIQSARADQGDVARIVSHEGKFVGYGHFSPQSQIRVRMLSWSESEVFGTEFYAKRLSRALRLREHMGLVGSAETTGFRLCHGEADEIPGFICDIYGDFAVFQALSAGVQHDLGFIVAALNELSIGGKKLRGIYERSDDATLKLEGCEQRAGLVHGEDPTRAGLIEILENGMRYGVDVAKGHKTGFYLDQRESRAYVRRMAKDKDVLNCFAYTGGFSVAASMGGAKSVTSVEISESALEAAQANVGRNPSSTRHEFVAADVFEYLRKARSEGKTFDLIVLDPPKFASRADQVDKAARGYKDINRLAFEMLRPGGMLCTFSCSGAISEDLFQKIVFGAVIDARREGKPVNGSIVHRFSQAPDHPVLLTFPEAYYLKGLAVSVL